MASNVPALQDDERFALMKVSVLLGLNYNCWVICFLLHVNGQREYIEALKIPVVIMVRKRTWKRHI